MNPRLAVRRRRVLTIRRTIAAAAVAVFLAMFTTIYVQMADGHDPALGPSVPPRGQTPEDTSTEGSDPLVPQQTAEAPLTTRQS